jgi:hypothetical protein
VDCANFQHVLGSIPDPAKAPCAAVSELGYFCIFFALGVSISLLSTLLTSTTIYFAPAESIELLETYTRYYAIIFRLITVRLLLAASITAPWQSAYSCSILQRRIWHLSNIISLLLLHKLLIAIQNSSSTCSSTY